MEQLKGSNSLLFMSFNTTNVKKNTIGYSHIVVELLGKLLQKLLGAFSEIILTLSPT